MALSREQRKFVAIMRARRRLERRLEDIDWELDVLAPQVKEIGELQAKGKKVSVELSPGETYFDADKH